MYEKIFKIQADFLKAISHSRRLEIILLLKNRKLDVTEIYTMLDLPQANISQHLMILRKAKIVITKKEGKKVLYQLASLKVLDLIFQVRKLLIELNPDQSLKKNLKNSVADLLPIHTDPVCDMRVSTIDTHFIHLHQDKTYYFCASGCLKKFKQNPEKYSQKKIDAKITTKINKKTQLP